MKNSMFVYLVRNQIDGKVYIGQCHRESLQVRWRHHCNRANIGSHYPLHVAIRELGAENFATEIISFADTREQLHELERRYIAEHKSYPPELGRGYNLSIGGQGSPGFKMSDEQRKRVFTEGLLRRKSISAMGNQHWLGKRHSEEAKEKIRLAKLGRPHSEEAIRKMRENWHETHGPRTIEKIRRSLLEYNRRKSA